MDTGGNPIPFAVDGNRIVVNDAKHHDKDIIITWTAKLFGNMKATLRRAKDRTMTAREWAQFGAFGVSLLVVLFIIVMFPNASDDERRHVEIEKKEKNPDEH